MEVAKSLAEKLIEVCKVNKSTFLDLGNCGLNDLSIELGLLEDLENIVELNLGNYFWKDGKKVSTNNFSKNTFSAIPNYYKTFTRNTGQRALIK